MDAGEMGLTSGLARSFAGEAERGGEVDPEADGDGATAGGRGRWGGGGDWGGWGFTLFSGLLTKMVQLCVCSLAPGFSSGVDSVPYLRKPGGGRPYRKDASGNQSRVTTRTRRRDDVDICG